MNLRRVVVLFCLSLLFASFAFGEAAYQITVRGLDAYRLSRLEGLVSDCVYDSTNDVAACVVSEAQMREVAKKGYGIATALIVPGSATASPLDTEKGSLSLDADFTDSDGDGMDDAWEAEKFGDLSHDGNGDMDAFGPASSPGNPLPGPDGVTDLWEYR